MMKIKVQKNVKLISYFLLWSSCILHSTSLLARPLLILHTNDLHGFLESSVEDPQRGGYARIRQIVHQEREKAEAEGIETLVVDGGDFMEGNLFYLANEGREVWDAYKAIGYDMAVMGNHDYMMGADELDQLFKISPPSFPYLCTNLNFKKKEKELYPDLTGGIKKYAFLERVGVKIGFIGLTTNQMVYKWMLGEGTIKKPFGVAKKTEKKLKKSGVDFIFALTHLGIKKDKKLAEKTEFIDLIIGGHSHTALKKVINKENLQNQPVPIVQAGYHGKYVGRLLVDLKKGEPLKVLDYRLIPVNQKISPEEEMKEQVRRARKILEDDLGANYLGEVVGIAKIPLEGSTKKITPWTALITDALRESLDADVGIYATQFQGSNLPSGPITREDIFQSHPRVFSPKDKDGWNVYKVEIYGLFIHMLVRVVLNYRLSLSFSGIDFDIIPKKKVKDSKKSKKRDFKIKNIRIKGEKIKYFKRYSVALPEGIVEGGLSMLRTLTLWLMANITKSDISAWEAIAQKVQKIGVIDKKYGRLYLGKRGGGEELPYYKSSQRVFRPLWVEANP